ncbi:MAG: BatD family protein [Bacteroidales bacterium]|nr:BatD family protein [Bacteroidales bacterium]
MRKILTAVIAILLNIAVYAQDDVEFNVICKHQVMVGEQFNVSYELDGSGSNFEAPNFNNFEIVGGPFSSSSSSVQIINGSVTKSNKTTYSFYLRAIKEGTFTIPAATITVNRKKVKSTTTDITVVAGSGSIGHSGSSSSGGDRSASSASNSSEVLLEAVPNKRSAYIGEQIVLTYKIYYNIAISQLSISKSPSYSGFWTKDITDNNGTLQQSSIVRDGKQYAVATVQEVVLIPQKTGILTIDPLDISCIAQIRTQRTRQRTNDPFEDFFGDVMGSNYTNVKKEIKSQPITIEVKPAPSAAKPETFKGAVGQFTFTSSIDKTEMQSNDAFTLTYTVSGKGNIELLDMPKPVFPPDFEVYDPKITTSTKNNSFGISGTKKVEYVVIPRVSGHFKLEQVDFTYFDPQKERYVTLPSDEYDLNIAKSDNEGSSGVIYAGGQEAIKVVGSDIRHIMTEAKLKKMSGTLFTTPLYYIIMGLLVVLFTVSLIMYSKINKFNKNEVLVRNKKATKTAKKRLQRAYNYFKVNDQNHFYEEFAQALWGYISDKLNIARSQLSMDTVKEMMFSKKAPEEIVNQFIELLNSCEFARFAPGDPGKKMDDLYQKGVEVISKAERVLK